MWRLCSISISLIKRVKPLISGMKSSPLFSIFFDKDRKKVNGRWSMNCGPSTIGYGLFRNDPALNQSRQTLRYNGAVIIKGYGSSTIDGIAAQYRPHDCSGQTLHGQHLTSYLALNGDSR